MCEYLSNLSLRKKKKERRKKGRRPSPNVGDLVNIVVGVNMNVVT